MTKEDAIYWKYELFDLSPMKETPLFEGIVILLITFFTVFIFFIGVTVLKVLINTTRVSVLSNFERLSKKERFKLMAKSRYVAMAFAVSIFSTSLMFFALFPSEKELTEKQGEEYLNEIILPYLFDNSVTKNIIHRYEDLYFFTEDDLSMTKVKYNKGHYVSGKAETVEGIIEKRFKIKGLYIVPIAEEDSYLLTSVSNITIHKEIAEGNYEISILFANEDDYQKLNEVYGEESVLSKTIEQPVMKDKYKR